MAPPPPPAREAATPLCLSGCWSGGVLLGWSVEPRPRPRGGVARSARADFAATTAALLFPNTFFTSHESIPSLPDAFAIFSAAYPRYGESELADRLRESEYDHLTGRTCLDYTGFGLFSHAQFPCASDPPAPAPSSSLATAADFDISYRAPGVDTAMEAAIRKRIMRFLNFSEEEYSMVCTASRASAFKLLGETYPFQTNRRLLTVYDHESEAVAAVLESSLRRGAKATAADFSWPSLRIRSASLNKTIISKRKNAKNRGLMIFPLQSMISGARYSYQWMRLAQENGWHVALDACAMGPKDMDTFGISLIQPDFLICSFFKIFGENPAGFAALLVRRSSGSIVESSMTTARSAGIVSIVPARAPSHLRRDCSDLDSSGDLGQIARARRSDHGESSSEGHPPPPPAIGGDLDRNPSEISDRSEGPEIQQTIEEERTEQEATEVECRGLNHADSLGLMLISGRLRYITNWLVNALTKLQHPHSEKGNTLVRIYGPRVKFDRGPAVAFNVFDWKGERIDPALVQKLADRSNISLSCGFLRNIWFSQKHERNSDAVVEKKLNGAAANASRKRGGVDLGISVVSASLGFLTSFEDAYRLWAFVAKFSDADFVERERWRYLALNQKMVEI
ncbi:unnamed protein product [Spirodela intermedia]|uniref:Uncharacterized protein n=1 Tax=Spirodela intermedia TaxID=51605 RepID=A0A7I8KSD0_SPIIN|nr:unnamed protein product [Spirodela intermedia]